MSPPLTSNPPQRRALRILATIVAGLVVLFVANTARSSEETATPLDQQSLLTVPLVETAEPTAIPTTEPLQLPTSTPEPTATAVPPTATPVPPTPVPTATQAPATPVPPTAVPTEAPADEDAISVADAGATADVEAEPTPTPPNPTPQPTAQPTPEPTATLAPTPTPEVLAIAPDPTPEPTAEPTATPTPIPLQSAAQLENYVLGEINSVRAQAGLGPLALDPAISSISRDWSQQMALGGFFEHRPGEQLNVMLPAGWRQWGENIASAPDIYWAQSSLENSPGHYANMVGNFTHVGIGVYTNGAQVWVTQNFARY